MTEGEQIKQPLKKKILRGVGVALGVLLLISAASAGWYLYYRESSALSDLKKNPSKLQELTQNETKRLVEQVGKLMELPAESPTLATVANVEELKKKEPFFNNSLNGDKVLIYTGIKKAILFRPSTGKIIEVAPIVIGPSEKVAGATDEASISGAPATTPKVVRPTATPTPVVTTAPPAEATPTPTESVTPAP